MRKRTTSRRSAISASPSTSTKNGMVLVALRLRDGAGNLISDNTYWPGNDDASHQMLNSLPQQNLDIEAAARTIEGERVVTRAAREQGQGAGTRHEAHASRSQGRADPARAVQRQLCRRACRASRASSTIRYPATLGESASISVRGWNVKPETVQVTATRARPQAYLPQPWQQQP